MEFEEKRTDNKQKRTKKYIQIQNNHKVTLNTLREQQYIYIYSAIKPNQNIKRGSEISPNFHISAIEWIGI